MRKIAVFACVVGGSLLALLLIVFWYLSGFQSGHGSIGGMMGQMMGSGGTNGMTYVMPTGVWIALVVLAVSAMVGVVGLVYFLAFPEIRPYPSTERLHSSTYSKVEPEMSWALLMRTSKPDEIKVLEVLAAHGGSYLQKFVVKEAGLSRLKAHRVVSRLAERGIVNVEPSGNTNKVSLAAWIKRDAVKSDLGTVSSGH